MVQTILVLLLSTSNLDTSLGYETLNPVNHVLSQMYNYGDFGRLSLLGRDRIPCVRTSPTTHRI